MHLSHLRRTNTVILIIPPLHARLSIVNNVVLRYASLDYTGKRKLLYLILYGGQVCYPGAEHSNTGGRHELRHLPEHTYTMTHPRSLL